jgi:hypothetical protein
VQSGFKSCSPCQILDARELPKVIPTQRRLKGAAAEPGQPLSAEAMAEPEQFLAAAVAAAGEQL